MKTQFMAIRTKENTESINQRMFNEHFWEKESKSYQKRAKPINSSSGMSKTLARFGQYKTIDNSQE